MKTFSTHKDINKELLSLRDKGIEKARITCFELVNGKPMKILMVTEFSLKTVILKSNRITAYLTNFYKKELADGAVVRVDIVNDENEYYTDGDHD